MICLEEHILDRGLSAATMPVMMQHAPYFGDIGKDYVDPPVPPDAPRPTFVNFKTSSELAMEPLDQRLRRMDETGIDMQVLSNSNMTQLAPKTEAAALAKNANDSLARAIAPYPDRFRGFFTLPWQDPPAAVDEAARCVQQLGLNATLLTGHAGAETLIDDQMFRPVLEKLAALDAPLYVHPGAPLEQVQKPYYAGFNREVTGRLSLFGWGWHHEAGIQLIRLIYSGVLDQYPRLKIISGHWGEMVPFFLQRLDDMIPMAASRLSRTATQTFRDQVWVTPSGMLTEPHFRFIRETVGSDRILFAVDYPYLSMTGARAWLEKLDVPAEEREAIAWGNAAKLLRIEA